MKQLPLGRGFWRRFARLLLIILGLLPYVGISFAVVLAWQRYMPVPPLPSTMFTWAMILSYFDHIHVFMSLSLLGAWASWYLFCKLVKYLWILTVAGN